MSSSSLTAPAIPGTIENWSGVEGHRLRYLATGSGRPLLLIHGLLGYSFSWRFNYSELSDIRQVLAPDLLGTGFSDRPADLECGMEACARRMLRWLSDMGMEQFDLVGTSHGGGVAALMAAIAPQRVGRLCLVAPVNPWSKHGRWITRVLATRFGAFGLRSAAPVIERLNHVWLARMYGDSRRIAPGTAEGYMAPMAIDGIWEYGLGVVGCWHADLSKLEDAYASIKQETLLIWGDRDPAVFVSSAQEIAKRIPGSRLEVFRGVGHLPYEEVPLDFNRVLRDFLLQ